MKRLYKKETVEKIISRFREKFPDITIATDIIIGYPTETDYDFKESMNFVKEFRPDVLNLSKFSKHKGTAAENLEYLDIKIVNKRNLDIMREHRRTALENKQKFLNKEIKVFVNKKFNENGFYEARDENYNIVLIPITNENKNILGKNIKVLIEKTGVHHMIGKIV